MESKKEIRWFISLMKEREWLEKKSMEGWFLKDLRMGGIRYVFEKGEPRHMVYAVERFDLPKNPLRREIEERTGAMEMARETGWEIICHDVAMDYYLTRPWEEGGSNEFYDSEEDRRKRADSYRRFFMQKISAMLGAVLLVCLAGILFYMIMPLDRWFSVFAMAYCAVVTVYILMMFGWIRLYERELCLTLDEWRSFYGTNNTVKKYRFILTIGGLEKYLRRQAAAGLHIRDMKLLRYTFVKGEPEETVYMMDTKYLANKRRKQAGEAAFKDSRDWEGRNNDWQVYSMEEAEQTGWSFVCAVESRNILYKAPAWRQLPELNRIKGIRVVSAIGSMAVFIIASGLLGGFIGGLVGYFLS